MPRLTPIHYGKFCKFLDYVGCSFKHQTGSHLIYTRTDLRRPIVVPKKKQLSMTVIQSNLRTLVISKEKYLEIIKIIK
ncbi:MAG: type II toxin-antitoxin system HicA family toxin [Candidatus Omnitrophica bacterium]|nr:type II toxin-antitoxin system HicA family toxin [Candidatus Omnitrophota bacterium]